MPAATVIDVHAHFLGLDVPASGTRLVVDDQATGRIMRGDKQFRAVTSALWDVAERLRQMDRAEVSHQVVSPVPVIMEHAWSSDVDATYAMAMNDSIAAACAASGGRLLGLGCLPFGDLDAVADELRRCLRSGLHGVEVGTRIGPYDLDAPELAPFWAECDSAGAAVFVHPIDEGREVVRRAGQPYDFGLGMLTDTAIAAAALVFGGVLERHPRLRVALAHGCGAFPWAYPRLRVAARRGGRDDTATWDALTRRLYADTLVFDDEHLRLLVHRFGADRLLLGSDAPFFPDQMRLSLRSVDEARESGALPADAGRALLTRNALDFLGMTTV